MKPTNISLPDEQRERLRRLAYERRTSISELVRLAVDAVYPPEKSGNERVSRDATHS